MTTPTFLPTTCGSTRRGRACIASILLLMLIAPALAQPATAPRERRTLVVPPNFKLVVVDRRTAVCQEGDEPWVRQALNEIQPTTRPTTMPSDLLERVTEHRDVLAERMTADLGLADPSEPRKMIDEQLVPILRRANDFNPPIFYFVSSELTVRNLLKNGWEDPLFYLNRAADRVAVNRRVDMSLLEGMDDTLLPAMYEPGDDVTSRKRKLIEAISATEAQLMEKVSIEGMYATQMTLVSFIGNTSIKPLSLTPQQDWLGIGLIGVLSGRYLAMINDKEPDGFLRVMMQDRPGNPIRSETVDLLNPTPADQMKPNFRPAYLDAYRRKSTRIVRAWIDRIPPGALAKTMNAIRAAKPADGPALVKVIADSTGIDLTAELLPTN